MKKSVFTDVQINEVMKSRGINRKSALKFLNREHALPSRRPRAGMAVVAPAKDVKLAAANDKPEAAPAQTMTPEERGKARAEGLRLFTLAGRPKKSDFIKVYGKRGHLMTWDQRADAGVPAAKFQAALAEKQGK
jgi:hypothetical protein